MKKTLVATVLVVLALVTSFGSTRHQLQASAGPAPNAAPSTGLAVPFTPYRTFLPFVGKPSPLLVHANHFGFVDTFGYGVVVGEAENISGANLQWPQISADFVDGNGNVVGTGSGPIGIWQLGHLPVGTTTCFIVRSSAPLSFSTYRLHEPSAAIGGRGWLQIGMSGLNGHYNADNGDYGITGYMTNSTQSNLDSIQAVATLYDHNGRVIGCRGWSASGPFAPGQSVLLFMFFPERDYADVTAFRVQADGEPPQ